MLKIVKNWTGSTMRNYIAFMVFALILLASGMHSDMASAAEEPNISYERVIAHGGGTYKGLGTSNSVEALNNAIQNGYKIIELDMELSSDQKIIMLHDWDRTASGYFGRSFDKKITQNNFLKLSIYRELEVLTFEKLAVIMQNNKEIRIVTDTKGDNLSLLSKISEEYPSLMDRIIPQIYDYDQFDKVEELGYTDIIFTLYALPELDTQKLITFVKDRGIYAVTMPDYLADTGICKELSNNGIKVYVHPISDVEDAWLYMKQGAYGVYSGIILPEEFEGFEKDYYLTSIEENKNEVKLTDQRVNNLQRLKMHGLKQGETVAYHIDDSIDVTNNQALSQLKNGKHKLTAEVYKNKECLGSLNYFFWKDAGAYRILQKKFEYRLDTLKEERAFDLVMKAGEVPEEIAELLGDSLIAKKGETLYYNGGISEYFTIGEEPLAVQEGSNGKLLLPLKDTIKQLGAASISMGKGSDVSIIYKNNKYMAMVNSYYIRKGFLITRIKDPVVLYLNKAMAGEEIYQSITGRSSVENDSIIIILPEGVDKDKIKQEQMIASAQLLF